MDILIAEDNDDDVVLMREAFHADGVPVSLNVVRDGAETLAYLRREPPYQDARRPGLLILDLNMPRKNGFEVLGELKADDSLATLPVVVLTTSAREEDIADCYRSGASSYVTKPDQLDEFRALVRELQHYWTEVSRTPQAS